MPIPYRVCVQGFSAFERSALASYFRLASNRTPAYSQVEAPADAQFLVVDADQAAAVNGVLASGRVGEAVFIGAQAPEGATAWRMRPIDPLHVLRELDAMVATQVPHRPALAGVPVAAGGPRAVRPHAAPGPVPARRASDSGPISLLSAADTQPARTRRPAHRPTQALLVDDSEIALRFLETRLLRFGLSTDRALSSGRALELMAQRAYDFVFLDVELGPGSELDGLALCQHIKRQHRQTAGPRPPVVLLVSAHHSELDRVRGTLAGADACIGKPLDNTLLTRLLAQHGVTPPAPTASRESAGATP